jgi:hypothetical protein
VESLPRKISGKRMAEIKEKGLAESDHHLTETLISNLKEVPDKVLGYF